MTNHLWIDLMLFGESHLPEGEVVGSLPLTSSVRRELCQNLLAWWYMSLGDVVGMTD